MNSQNIKKIEEGGNQRDEGKERNLKIQFQKIMTQLHTYTQITYCMYTHKHTQKDHYHAERSLPCNW